MRCPNYRPLRRIPSCRWFGYWALVGAAAATPAVMMWRLGLWRGSWKAAMEPGIRSMLYFGGTITLKHISRLFGTTLKVLLGRFWGADALGIYGRAYQIIRLPTDYPTGQ